MDFTPNTYKPSILIVDDVPDNLRMLIAILKEQDFTIRPVRDGRMALRSALAAPPDIILLDIVMAPLNGYDVCRELKKNERTSHIPIIFISGLNETTDKLMAFKLGGVDFIDKPFEPAEVIARINAHLYITQLTTELEHKNRKLAIEIEDRNIAYEKLKRLQRELRQNNIYLEERVQREVKKRQAQQEILIQRSKLESLGEVAAGMAHEINQPLAGISMGLDNMIYKLSSAPIDPQYIKEKFEVLQEHVNRIKNIINHVRVFSREQSNEQVEKIDVKAVCLNAISMVQQQYKYHGIDILFTETDPPWRIMANRYKLEQVLLNLLSNARDAIHGKESVECYEGCYENPLSMKNQIEITLNGDDSHVLLHVKDCGNGIQATHMDKIFNPFYTTKPPEQGTGLGLSISYGIIKEFNGDITAKSEPGKGTVMQISLPRA